MQISTKLKALSLSFIIIVILFVSFFYKINTERDLLTSDWKQVQIGDDIAKLKEKIGLQGISHNIVSGDGEATFTREGFLGYYLYRLNVRFSGLSHRDDDDFSNVRVKFFEIKRENTFLGWLKAQRIHWINIFSSEKDYSL